MKKPQNESVFKLFHLLRLTFPSSQLFYIIFFGFKFIGLFISTHNAKGYEDNLITVSGILSKLTLFGHSLRNINGYSIISLAIFVLLLYIVLHMTIIYFQLRKLYQNQSLNQCDFLFTKRFMSKSYKTFIRLFGVIIIFLLFLSHYIQEFLAFVVFVAILQNKINANDSIFDQDKSIILNDFKENALFTPITLGVINLLSIIILNCFLFGFMLLNSTKALWLRSGFNGYSNKLIILCLMIFFFFQSLNSLFYFFNEVYKKEYRIIFNISAVGLLSLFLFSHLKHFNHYHSFIPQFNLFICVWCWYSGSLEILIYYICDKPFTQVYSFLKLIAELTNAVLVTYLILAFNNRYFLSLFTEHLFNSNQKHTCIGESFAYIHLLTKVLMNNLPHHLELVSMLHIHKSKCVTPGCICLKLLNDSNNKEKTPNDISFKEMLIIIGEQDIANRIYQLYKKNKHQSYPLEDYCILHCGYIYEIKQHRTLALYLASKYLNSKLRLSLLSKCYLYEMKKQIINEMFDKKNTKCFVNNTNDNAKGMINYLDIVNKSNKTKSINSNLKSFYDYINFIDIIKNLMVVCCNGLESILAIRSSLESNSKSRIAMNRRQYEHFIISCQKIKKNNDKLIQLITTQMKGEVLSHSELSYLLTNYFDFLYKRIPNHIKGIFSSLSSVSDIPKNEHLRDYLKYNISNPLILKFTQSDSFIIDYISTDLCEKLGYYKGSLIGKDIHDYIPIEIVSNHKLFMKQFLFIQNANIERDTFILSAEDNLVNIKIDCKVLPCITNPFQIIIDAKVINHKSLTFFTYYLIIDNDLKILSVNKRFEEQFFFNIKMIELLKVNFCGFFGFNQGRFLKKAHELFKKHKLVNLEEKTKAISILSNVKQEKVFSYRKIRNTMKFSQNYFEDIIEKQQVIDGLSVLIKIVNDLGLDIEWYNRIRHLNERIKLSLDYTLPHRLNTFYKSLFYLRQIGSQRYYIVKMTEYVNVKKIIRNVLCLHESLMKQKIPDVNLFPEMNGPMKAMMKLSSQSITNLDKAKGIRNIKSCFYSNVSEMSPNASKGFDSELMSQSNSTKFNLLSKKASSNNLNLNRSTKPENSISTDNNLNSANTLTSWTKKKSTHNHNHNSTVLNKENDYIINESKRLQMYISYNRRSKRYTLFFYITAIVLLMLICAFILLKYLLTTINKGLFNINIFSSMVKIDILFGALLNNGLCMQIDNDPLNAISARVMTERFIPISNDLIQHYSVFISYINTFVSYTNLKSLFDIINKEDSYDYLQSNWSIKTVSSSLTELIYILRLLFSESILVNNPLCRFKDLFYNEKYKQNNTIVEGLEASVEEQLLFFNIYNLMNKIKPKFDLILEQSSSIMFNYHQFFSQVVIIYSVVVWIVTMWLVFVLVNKVLIDQKLTKTICSYIYSQNSQEENAEQKLSAFRDVIGDFSKKKIDMFESIKNKKNSHPPYSNPLIIKFNRNSNNSTTQSRDMSASAYVLASGSLSVTPFSQITKQSIHNKTIRLQMQSLPNNQKTVLSNVVNTEILIVIIVVIAISSIEVASALLSVQWEKQIVFSKRIALDFLERIPILIELLFYSEISAVVNDIFYIQNDYTKPTMREKYMNYYKRNVDIEKNTQVNYLNDSLYSTIYYEALLVEENILQFTSQEKHLLPSLRLWETRFDEKNGLCVYGVLGSNYNSNNQGRFISHIDFFKKFSHDVTICRLQSESVASNDLDSSIEFLLVGLTNAYYDFAKADKEGEERIDVFLKSLNIYHKNYAYVMKLAFRTYSHYLLNELTMFHYTIISNDLLLSIALLIVIFAIFAYAIICIIQKSDHYKNLLIFFVSLPFSTLEIDLHLYDE